MNYIPHVKIQNLQMKRLQRCISKLVIIASKVSILICRYIRFVELLHEFVSFEICVQILYDTFYIVDLADTDDILSEALYYMYDELCSLCPPDSQSDQRLDSVKTPDHQSDQCIDSVETITAAWQTSLSLVKYMTSISAFVRTSALNGK